MLKHALFLAQVATIGLSSLVLAQQGPPAASPVEVLRVRSEVQAAAVVRPAPAPRPTVRRTRLRTTAALPHPRHTRASARHRVDPKPVASRQPLRGLLALHTVTTSLGTTQQQMMSAVAHIPGYHTGDAAWLLTTAYGSWGTADWYHGKVYISPTVPSDRTYDVVAHEWSHLLTVKDYDGDVEAAKAAMNHWFDASAGLVGAERAADCMARQLGATWTHYTPCTDSHWQAGARALLSGDRLPNP